MPKSKLLGVGVGNETSSRENQPPRKKRLTKVETLNREEGGTQGGTMPWVCRGHKRASQLHWASNLAHQEETVCLKEIRRSNYADLF